jgi:hypothetical protein
MPRFIFAIAFLAAAISGGQAELIWDQFPRYQPAPASDTGFCSGYETYNSRNEQLRSVSNFPVTFSDNNMINAWGSRLYITGGNRETVIFSGSNELSNDGSKLTIFYSKQNYTMDVVYSDAEGHIIARLALTCGAGAD